MAKCEYKFSFEIKCEEPINELRIKLIDKGGRKIVAAAAPVETKQESLDFGSSDDDISDDIPPEMNAVF